jgi:drug/metabolite transporter (DMT)-like permease
MGLNQYRTLLVFLLVSVVFGGTFVAAKAGQAYVPPLLLVALRFDIAAVVLLGYVLLTRSRSEWLPKTRGDIVGIIAAGFFAIGLSNGLLFVGQASVSSGVGAILFALVPIFSPLFAGILLSDEQLSTAGAVGTLVGLVGVGMVIDITPATVVETFNGGAMLILAGAMSLGLGTVLVRRSNPSLSSTVRTAWALPISALLIHALSAGVGESPAAIEWTLGAVIAVGYLSICAGVIAYIAYFGLIDEIGATQSSLVFYVSPVFATLGGWLLLGEALSATTITGFGVIVVGFAIIGHKSLTPVVRRAIAQSTGRWQHIESRSN